MAKRPSKIDEYLSMSFDDFNKLTQPELRKIVTSLGRATTRRIRQLEAVGGERSPAVRAITAQGKPSAAGGKSLNELRTEYAKARSFFTNRTATVEGFQAFEAEMKSKIGESNYTQLSKSKTRAVYKAIDRLSQQHPSWGSDQVRQAVFNIAKHTKDRRRIGANKLIDAVNEHATEIYVAIQDVREGDESGVDYSAIFGWDDISD